MAEKSREQILKIAAVVCIVLLVGDRLVFTPLINLWQTRQARIEELDKSVGKGVLLLDREEALQSRWDEMKKAALPKDMPVAENLVLQSVNRWVQTSGITILTLKPQWKISETEAAWLECRAGAQGTLENVARFLFELERDELPLKIEHVEITANDETGRLLTLTVLFTGLQFVEPKQQL